MLKSVAPETGGSFHSIIAKYHYYLTMHNLQRVGGVVASIAERDAGGIPISLRILLRASLILGTD